MDDRQLTRMLTTIYDVLPDDPRDALAVLATCLASVAHSSGYSESVTLDVLRNKYARLTNAETEIRQ